MNLIVDGNNLAHRARYVFNLSFRGQDTSVLYGVMRMLMALISKYTPATVTFCWDGGTPGFRRRLIPEYKAGRKRDEDPTWPAFLVQLEDLHEVLPYTGILQVKRRGIEADDLMAQAVLMLDEYSIIVSGDGDMLQCVNDKVSVLKPGKKERLITADNFEDEIGYPPFKHVAATCLMGDSSDNIKGVRGIGPKTAVKLLANDNVLANATPKQKERIEAFISSGGYNAAYTAMDLSHDCAGAREALLSATWGGYKQRLYKWCIERGFTSLIEAGSLGKIFGSLRKPKFVANDFTVPRIWDCRRYVWEGEYLGEWGCDDVR